MQLLISILGSLIAAAIVAVISYSSGRKAGAISERKIFEQRIKSAGEVYAARLGKLIHDAQRYWATSYKEGIESKSRAIVDTRNQFSFSLTGLSRLLNSQIDKMEKILEDVQPGQLDQERAKQLGMLIRVLGDTWPGKTEQLKYETRKILADLGLEPERASA
jgi:hypothetical protein